MFSLCCFFKFFQHLKCQLLITLCIMHEPFMMNESIDLPGTNPATETKKLFHLDLRFGWVVLSPYTRFCYDKDNICVLVILFYFVMLWNTPTKNTIACHSCHIFRVMETPICKFNLFLEQYCSRSDDVLSLPPACDRGPHSSSTDVLLSCCQHEHTDSHQAPQQNK